jgi:hypothetical protein
MRCFFSIVAPRREIGQEIHFGSFSKNPSMGSVDDGFEFCNVFVKLHRNFTSPNTAPSWSRHLARAVQSAAEVKNFTLGLIKSLSKFRHLPCGLLVAGQSVELAARRMLFMTAQCIFRVTQK